MLTVESSQNVGLLFAVASPGGHAAEQPQVGCKSCSGAFIQLSILGDEHETMCVVCRCVVTDLGAFVLINVYIPNAGDRKAGDGERVAFKVRFLEALKQKADVLRDGGREVYIIQA